MTAGSDQFREAAGALLGALSVFADQPQWRTFATVAHGEVSRAVASLDALPSGSRDQLRADVVVDAAEGLRLLTARLAALHEKQPPPLPQAEQPVLLLSLRVHLAELRTVLEVR